MKRRCFVKAVIASPLAAVPTLAAYGEAGRVSFVNTTTIPQPLASFVAGLRSAFDLTPYIINYKQGVTKVRLRANVYAEGTVARESPGFVPFQSQFAEYTFSYPVLQYDGTASPSLGNGASAARIQIEATDTEFDDPVSAVGSRILRVYVESALATIKAGLEEWKSFDALTRAVCGDAAPGSSPRGRLDLIGRVFEITPGMISGETEAAATIQFPCTVRAIDRDNRPVFRSTSGERDIVSIHAMRVPPIDGEIILQDLVIRDNRGWYDTGEAGVRIKDRFQGRSVRIERCEFIRCQNAVAGGAIGQTLRIYDCRVVDCGFDTQAHSFYLQPEWLEFFGNIVMYSPGNKLARAHQLKTRALNGRIFGNKFLMNDCAASYLIDISNGGNYQIAGNVFHHGPSSDNRVATLVAFAPEGASADYGTRPFVFSPGRQFRLTARNNTMISDFEGDTRFFVIDNRSGKRAEGDTSNTFPDPLIVEDNIYHSAGPRVLVERRERSAGLSRDIDLSKKYLNNSPLSANDFASADPRGFNPKVALRNTAGPYLARRFTATTYLGTGSTMHTFSERGAL